MIAPAQPHPLILASASPRRAELLRTAGYRFEVLPAPVEEPPAARADRPAALFAESIADLKADAVARLRPLATVLAADTIVALGTRIIGKPADADDARRILASLSGTRHECITGVALRAPGGRRVTRHVITQLQMRPMSEQDLEAYLASGEWQGKAGAYAFQETADRFLSIVSGSRTNVVGLPMELVAVLLAEWSGSKP